MCERGDNHSWTLVQNHNLSVCPPNDDGSHPTWCWVEYYLPNEYSACMNDEDMGFDLDKAEADLTPEELVARNAAIQNACLAECENVRKDPNGNYVNVCEVEKLGDIRPHDDSLAAGEVDCTRAEFFNGKADANEDSSGQSIDWGGGELRPGVACDLNATCCNEFDAFVCSPGMGWGTSGGHGGDYFATSESGSDLTMDMPPNNGDDTEELYVEAEYTALECGDETCPFYLGHLLADGNGAVWNIKYPGEFLGIDVPVRKEVKNLHVELVSPVIGVWAPDEDAQRVAFQSGSLSLRVDFEVEKASGSAVSAGDGSYEVVVTNDSDAIGNFHDGGAFSLVTSFPIGQGTGILELSLSPQLFPPIAQWDGPAGLECESPEGALLDLAFDGSIEPNGLDYVTYIEVDGSPANVDHQLSLGQHEVSLRIENEMGAADRSDPEVIEVVDFTPPQLWCPGDAQVECSAFFGSSASFDPQVQSFLNSAAAVDVCDSDPSLSNDAPSFFPVGSTPVTFYAHDDYWNSQQCSSTLTVVDSTAPDIICPEPIVVECNQAGGVDASDPQVAPFLIGATAGDTCDPDPAISSDAPDFFGVGTTDVVFTATDAYGNAAQCTSSVTIADTTPPEISLSLSPDVLWPPNHKLETVTASVEVTDVCDPSPTFVLSDVVSNEPDNGTGDGDTANDIQGASIGSADTSLRLRKERSGSGTGRVYTATYVASDAANNTATATGTVSVPH